MKTSEAKTMKSASSTSGAGRSQFVTLSLQLPAGIAIAALLLGAAGPPASALPLRAAESFLLACAAQDGRGDVCDERRIQGTGLEFTFGTFTGGSPNVGAMGTATAETSGGQGGLRPMATASGSALGGGVDLFDRVQNGGDALAILTYEVAIVELIAPPVFTPLVPIEARIRAETSAFASPTAGGSDARARADITLLRMDPPDTRFIRFEQFTAEDFSDPSREFFPDSLDETVDILVTRDTVLEFSLNALANTFADPSSVPRAELRALARAVADPVLSFDQAAFDAMAAAQGFPTFNLADHFRFELSPLLFTGLEPPPTSGVPSPSTIVLTSLGAGGLVLLHGLHHRWLATGRRLLRRVTRARWARRRVHCAHAHGCLI
jgi:hypothetical protein